MAMADNEQEPKKRKGISGTVFVAGLFLGLGIGWLLGQMLPGLFIGMGVGFLASAIVRYKLGEW